MSEPGASAEQLSINKTPCYIVSFLDNGDIRNINSQFLEALEYTASEVVGKKKFIQLLTPGSRIFFQTHLFPIVKINGQEQEIFLTFRTANSSDLPVLLNMSADQNGEIHAAGILISKRNTYDNALLEAKHAAEKALKENVELGLLRSRLEKNQNLLEIQLQNLTRINKENEEVNKLLSHDLQEPFRKIGLISTFIQEELGPVLSDQKIPEFLEKISNLSSKSRNLLVKIQKYHSLHLAEVKSKVDLQITLHNALEAARIQEVDIDLSSLLVTEVEGDPRYLKQLFVELFENSDKFRSDLRPLRISISSERITRNIYRATEKKYKYGQFVRIAVTDNGTGFDNKHASLAFQLLQKLHQHPGDGLGLAFCKKIVELHHGEIGIRSLKEVGTIVIITLPA